MVPAQVVFISLRTVQTIYTNTKENVKPRNATLRIDLTPHNKETVVLNYISLPCVMFFSWTFQGDMVTGQ